MEKKSKAVILSCIFVLALAAFLFWGVRIRAEESTAQESIGEEALSMDYDKLAQALNVNREEEYYPCYVDYLCYLKNKYPKKAKLAGVTEDQSGYSSIRIWNGNGYTVKAAWPSDTKQDGFDLQWTWENKELQAVIEGLIEEGKGKLAAGSENTDMIVSGNLYELTDNKFQPGIDYDLNDDEIKQIQELLEENICKKEDKEKTAEIRFILTLYDADEREQMSFGISIDGRIYSEDGKKIEDDRLQTLVDSMIIKGK